MEVIGQFLRAQAAAVPPITGICLVIALAISIGGFWRVVYFISIGYAFAIVGMVAAVVVAMLRAGNVHWLILAQGLFLAIWGLRLGVYLVVREASPAFAPQIKETHERSGRVRFPVRVLIWLSVSILYVLMFSPVIFAQRALMASGESRIMQPAFVLVSVLGLVIMAAGLVLEGIADRQKDRYKAQHPRRFCDVGLYRVVRCPNYLGEIMVWLGLLVSAMGAYTAPVHWVMSASGFICILLIMMGSTKRLERAQDDRYGSDADYQKYVKTVPVLFPCVPVYSLRRVRVYLE